MIKKIGFSLSKCLRDIHLGIVDIEQVTLIVAGTNFDPSNEAHVNQIIDLYSHYDKTPWSGIDDVWLRRMIDTLFHTGRLLQPRRENVPLPHRPNHWLDLVDASLMSESGRQAYQDFIITNSLS